MKKIIYQKILLDCLIFFLIAIFGISSIIWVFQAVNFLDIMIEDGRNYNVYILFTLLSFPKIISKVLPFCIFFSFSYIFIKYEMKNELVIFWNHGIEKIKVINLFLILSFFVLLFQTILLTIIVPKSQEIAKDQIRTSSVDYFEGLIKPQKFNDTVKGLTIYAEEKNSENEFKNIYIKKSSSNAFQITFAKKGVFELKGERKILALYDGQTLNNNNEKITNFKFSKSDFGLENMVSHVVVHKKLQEQSTIGLIKCVKSVYEKIERRILNCQRSNPRNVYKELLKRVIAPFYLPLLILIASINLLISKEKIGYLRYRFLVFLYGLLVIVISESSLGLVDKNFTNNIFLILIPLILISITYLTIVFNLKFNLAKN